MILFRLLQSSPSQVQFVRDTSWLTIDIQKRNLLTSHLEIA